MEDRRLENHRRRAVPHLRRDTAHDPGQTDRVLAVGDHEHPRIEGTRDMVERLERLAIARSPHDDQALGDRIGVVGVLRLPKLMHHVVRDVDDGADRSHAGREEAALHPLGRRPVRDAGEPARREARAEVRLIDLERDMVARRLGRLAHRVLWPAHGPAGEGRDLASKADHRERVATVRLHVDVEDRLADDRLEGGPEWMLFARSEHMDPVGIGPETELSGAAQHAVTDDAADLRALDPALSRKEGADPRHRHELPHDQVLGAAHDCQGLPGPDVDPRQPQRVRVGMPRHIEHPADDDIGPVGAGHLDRRDLHATQGQLLGECRGAQRKVDVVRQPGERDAHRFSARPRTGRARAGRRT